MHCPFCDAADSKVIDSRLVAEGKQVRRRRACIACEERFTTYETVELMVPRIIKRDGRRNPFDEDKLRAGLIKALEKSQVSMHQVEETVADIVHQLRVTGEREISSSLLGELVMDKLKRLDQVAYVRFASVYRSFTDVNAFREEINRLEQDKADA